MRFTAYDKTVSVHHECSACGYGWNDAKRGECPRCGATDELAVDQLALLELPGGGAVSTSEEDPEGTPADSGSTPDASTDWDDGVWETPTPVVRVSEPDQLGFAIVADKPAYRIPLMAEIEAGEDCGLRTVSTFSGCGGSCLGFKMAGYRTLWASEFIPAAADTYEANFPGVTVSRDDVRTVTPEMILEAAGLDVGDLDVFEGSPPCASFSMAGKREKAWGEVKKYSDTEQRVDDLFFEYARLVKGLQPKVFTAENVSGLVVGKALGYFREIFTALEDCGYRVGAQVLDAQWLGVPQRRRRLIFVGVRRDLGIEPPFPEPFTYRYSIRDALPWLGGVEWRDGANNSGGWFTNETDGSVPAKTITAGGYGGGTKTDTLVTARIVADQRTSKHSDVDFHEQSLEEPFPTITATGIGSDWRGDWQIEGPPSRERFGKSREMSLDEPMDPIRAGGGGDDSNYRLAAPTAEELAEVSIERFAIGREYDNLGPGDQSSKYLNLIRPDADEPCPTVTQTGGNLGAASVVHPTEKRKFTILELKRLSGFPDDFVLTGTWGQQWERIGRAVPPPMAREIAYAIRRGVFKR